MYPPKFQSFSLYFEAMSSTAVSNPAAQQSSKSARKKKGKSDAPAKTPTAPADTETGGDSPGAMEGATNGADGAYESPYLKDLYRYDHARAESWDMVDSSAGIYATSRRNS